METLEVLFSCAPYPHFEINLVRHTTGRARGCTSSVIETQAHGDALCSGEFLRDKFWRGYSIVKSIVNVRANHG